MGSLTLRPWSSGPGYVAYRDETGSDFIQTLVEVFRADPGREVLELLTEVCVGRGLDSSSASPPHPVGESDPPLGAGHWPGEMDSS